MQSWPEEPFASFRNPGRVCPRGPESMDRGSIVSRQSHLTYEDLLEIVEVIKSSGQFSEFHLKVGDIEVDLRRRGASAATVVPAVQPAVERAMPPEPPRTAAAHVPAATPSRTADAWPEGSIVVRSPMVGTFYRAPQPGARPFVEVGQEVAPETVVCIIEVMKLMNSIPAATSGVVTHVLVEDAGAVEYGQPLIVLRPK